MNYSSLLCLDDFHSNPVSENLMHRFILCKLRWKLRMRGKFDWQVLEYLVQPLLNIKIFKIFFWFCSSTPNRWMNKSKIFKLFSTTNRPNQRIQPAPPNNELNKPTKQIHQQTNKTNRKNQRNRPAPPKHLQPQAGIDP